LTSFGPINPPNGALAFFSTVLWISQLTEEVHAALRLGIDPAALWRKRKRYGLT
jgi:hypothetical protein